MTKWIGAILTAMVVAGAATDADAKKYFVGVKGGVDMARLNGDGTDELDSRNQFMGGAFFGIDFTEDFAVQLEALYIQKGAEGPYGTAAGDTVNAAFKLDYIEFPVIFKAGFSDSKTIGFSLYAGPTFGFNLSAEAEDLDTQVTEELDAESFEFGVAFGGGVEYQLSSMSIIGDVRYSMGLTDAVKETDVQNSGVEIMVGIQIPIGGP